jgi:hypothetical protein
MADSPQIGAVDLGLPTAQLPQNEDAFSQYHGLPFSPSIRNASPKPATKNGTVGNPQITEQLSSSSIGSRAI